MLRDDEDWEMKDFDVEIDGWGTENVKARDIEAAVERAVSEYFWQDPHDVADWVVKATCNGRIFSVRAEPEVSFWVHEVQVPARPEGEKK